jgi:hypothetical protein
MPIRSAPFLALQRLVGGAVALPRPRMTLKTMFVFVAFLSVASAMSAAKLRTKQRERAAILAIQMQGGFVAYDWQLHNLHAKSFLEERSAPGPRWLRAILRDDFFAAAAIVHFDSPDKGRDADLAFLDALPHVVDLRLTTGRVTQRGLKRVAELPLRRLVMRQVSVADNAWKQLAFATSLKELYIAKCDLCDADLQCLSRLSKLETLRLTKTGVSKAASESLQRLLPACKIVVTD